MLTHRSADGEPLEKGRLHLPFAAVCPDWAARRGNAPVAEDDFPG